MKKSLQVKRRTIAKHSYIILVEIEYIISLMVAYFFGAENYMIFISLLVGSILMGYGTSYLYWYLIESNNDKSSSNENKVD